MSEFLDQTDARKSRILEAALIEFADKGYKKASTNTIVREAGVSKGLLFHYFISKRDLYILLYKTARETVTNELYENVNFADKDVLKRVRQSTMVKIESYLKHPLFMSLFEKSALLDDPAMIEELMAFDKLLQKQSYEKLFSNIDYYAFADALNIDRCLEVVKWTVDKISVDWQKKYNGVYDDAAFDELKMDINHYLDLFREAFYR